MDAAADHALLPVIPEETLSLAQEVARSVALSLLLSMDFAPSSTPPPLSEMVANELPRILAGPVRSVPGLRAALGPVALQLDAQPWDVDAGALLRAYLGKIEGDAALVRRVTSFIKYNGHRDFVFEVVKRQHKPPTASLRRVRRVTAAVAKDLCVADVSAGDVEIAYDTVHAELM